MKILIDENIPKHVRRHLPGHDVFTVTQAGWAGTKNGALLKLMSGQFDVFLTMDGNLQYQQNLANFPIRFVRLIAINNRIESLEPLMPRVLEILETLQPGELVEVGELPNHED